ncbi:MAG: alpha-amylase, partial [Flavobacteriales bacterium]|nr:alpha-amylase [Flavobacteriales bacterium]
YQPVSTNRIKCLLKNYRLSDDIAFRFSDKGWAEYPLTADKFARWTHEVAGNGEVINLFMDYETFGEHQWESTGIFKFLHHLPEEILRHPDFSFKTPSEVLSSYDSKGEYNAHELTSWADTERDLSAWRSNSMQHNALNILYDLEYTILLLNDKKILDQWSKLQTSDHFYYMCTKYWADGDVHKYFSPYESPYEAYIYFMNVISNLENEVNKRIEEVYDVAKSPSLAIA